MLPTFWGALLQSANWPELGEFKEELEEVAVNGRPERAVTTVLNCQPPARIHDTPLWSHRLPLPKGSGSTAVDEKVCLMSVESGPRFRP